MKAINNFINEKLKITKKMLNNKYNGYEFIDLCLPSGILWAKCNVGAKTETEYGDYFAWGEIETKDWYRSTTYKYGDNNNLTKYNNKDKLTKLELKDDAANVNMEGKWSMPTKEQFKELIDNAKNEWIENYNDSGINGILFTGKNSNTIFFPAAGYSLSGIHEENKVGRYWSSTCNETYYDESVCLHFQNVTLFNSNQGRCIGMPIRGIIN